MMTSASCVAFSFAGARQFRLFFGDVTLFERLCRLYFFRGDGEFQCLRFLFSERRARSRDLRFRLGFALDRLVSASATMTRSSLFAFASPMEPFLSASATEIFASLMAFAAASLPSATI